MIMQTQTDAEKLARLLTTAASGKIYTNEMMKNKTHVRHQTTYSTMDWVPKKKKNIKVRKRSYVYVKLLFVC